MVWYGSRLPTQLHGLIHWLASRPVEPFHTGARAAENRLVQFRATRISSHFTVPAVAVPLEATSRMPAKLSFKELLLTVTCHAAGSLSRSGEMMSFVV